MKFRREDGVIFEACSNTQASAFLQSGLIPVKEEEPKVIEPKADAPVARRGRKPKEA